jgi:hypothetical protein
MGKNKGSVYRHYSQDTGNGINRSQSGHLEKNGIGKKNESRQTKNKQGKMKISLIFKNGSSPPESNQVNQRRNQEDRYCKSIA